MSGDTKYCSNCCKNIESRIFFMHERMCSINVKKCPKCNKPFTIEDLEEHIQQDHGETVCEFCNKKFANSEIEKHSKMCDSKMVPCAYCELTLLLRELKEHQKSCGAITEPCPKCGRYVQRKEMDNHLIEGCPPPKNDRRSVDTIHNSSRLSFNMNNNIIDNYIPINNNNFNIEDYLIEGENKKIDIKLHDNINKPNLSIRPQSGKKILNENAKKNMANLGNNSSIKTNNLNNIINNNNKMNINNDNKMNINNDDKMNINNKNETKNKNNIRAGKPSKTYKISNDNNIKLNNYMNRQNNNSKNPVVLKPTNNKNTNTNTKTTRYNNKNNTNINTVKKSTKPSFAQSLSKGNLNSSSKVSKIKKENEDLRKSREKNFFKGSKNLEKGNLNKEVKNNNYTNKKGIIGDEDYLVNYNFGDFGGINDIMDDEQLYQKAIEESLKDKTNIYKK